MKDEKFTIGRKELEDLLDKMVRKYYIEWDRTRFPSKTRDFLIDVIDELRKIDEV